MHLVIVGVQSLVGVGDNVPVQQVNLYLAQAEPEESVNLARCEGVIDGPVLETRCPRVTVRLRGLGYRLGLGLGLGPAR